MNTKKPSSGMVAFSVFLTVIITAITWLILFNILEDNYRLLHQVPDETALGIFRNFTRAATVTVEMLGWSHFVMFSVLPAIAFALAYPCIGRLITSVASFLANRVDRVFEFKDNDSIGTLSPDGLLLFGTLWPVSVFAIPLLAIALLIGSIYRPLWK